MGTSDYQYFYMWLIMIDQKSIHNLCNSKDLDDNKKGLDLLIDNYSELKDKNTAWMDLIHITNLPEKKDSEDSKRKVKSIKLKTVRFLTEEIPNKFKTKDYEELLDVLKAIRSVPFDLWIEKDLIWSYLIKLIDDKRPRFSTDGASVLRSMFVYVENKKKATDDLFRLTESDNKYTKYYAAFTLGYRFKEIENKEKWRKFLDLAKKNDTVILRGIALSLGYAIEFLNTDEEKTESWEILNEFLHKQDDIIKLGSISSLLLSFRYLLNGHKEKAINMLYKLIEESDNSDIISMVAIILGHNYSYIDDKNSAYKCLITLSNSNSLSIQCYAYHSLGRIYVYNAAHSAKEERKENLIKAIDYYKNANNCSSYDWSNSSHFCQLFYETLFDLFYGKIHLTEEEIVKRFDFPIFSENEQKIKNKLINVLKNSADLLNKFNYIDPNSNESKKIFDDLKNHCDAIIWTLDDVKPIYPFLSITIQQIILEESPDSIEIIRDKFKLAAKKDTSYNPILELANKLERNDEKNAENINLIANELKKLAHSEMNKDIGDNLDEIIKEMDCNKKIEFLAQTASNLNNCILANIFQEVKTTNATLDIIKQRTELALLKLNELEIPIESSKINGEIVITAGPNFIGIAGVACELHIPIIEVELAEYFGNLRNSKIRCIKIGEMKKTVADKIKQIISSPNNKQRIINGLHVNDKIIYLNP